MYQELRVFFFSFSLFLPVFAVACVGQEEDDVANGEIATGNGEEIAEIMAGYGIETEVTPGTGAECDCSKEESNEHCDYMFIPASQCECSSPQGGYAQCDSYQGAYLSFGAWINNSDYYRAAFSCAIPEIYRLGAGYDVSYIGQVAYYSRTRDATYFTWGGLRTASTYGVTWQNRGECENDSVTSTIQWCPIDIGTPIASTQPLVNLDVLLSRDDQQQDYPIFQGVRVCYIRE